MHIIGTLIAQSVQDVKFAGRTLRRNPGFTVTALLSLAIGIGVNVSIFGFVNALFLRPLPVRSSEDLVSIYQRSRGGAGEFTSFSFPDYEYYRDRNAVFSGMLAYARFPMSFRAEDRAEQIDGEFVSGNYFSVLGVESMLGRTFHPEEGRTPGSDPIVVLSYEFWERRFGADRNIIGRLISLGGSPFTVIGVAPKEFHGLVMDWLDPPSLWVPITMYRQVSPSLGEIDVLHSWGMQSFDVVGRLRPGRRFPDAAKDMAALAARIGQDHPERIKTWSQAEAAEMGDLAAVVFPSNKARFWPAARGEAINFFGLLTCVAALVLLIACFNVANLTLARASKRRKELALRLSLGAGSARLVRQLLTESLVLSLAGTAAGLAVAAWTSNFLSGFNQSFHVPLSPNAGFDGRVLMFAAGVSLLSGLLFGIMPARLSSRSDLISALKSSVESTGRHRLHSRDVLVAVQVALSVMLLVAAGLFIQTVRNAQATDVTVRSADVLMANLDLSSRGYKEAPGGVFYSLLLERVRAIPGVRDAALVFIVPMGGRRGGTNIVIKPFEAPGTARRVQVGFNVVSPGYFRTVGIPVVRGREFTDADRAGAPAVAVVNEEMARRLFAGKDPVGMQFELSWPPAAMVEITGVVRDGKFRNYRVPMEPTIYVPLAQRYQNDMSLEVRAAGDPLGLLAPLRREVAALDKDLPLTGVRTLKAHLDKAMARERATALLLSALGMLALVLAAIGLYGILSYAVAQRTREIGIRMALGAQRGAVLRMVLARGMTVVATGLAGGFVAAFLSSRLISSLLYGVSPTDPLTFGTTALALTSVAMLAAVIPARRASRVDPIIALRHE